MAVTRWQQTLRKSRVSLSHPSAWCVVYTQPIIAADRSYNCTNICTHCKCLVNVCNLKRHAAAKPSLQFWLAYSTWSGTCIYYPVIRDGGSNEPRASIENYGLDGRALGLNSGLPGFKSNALLDRMTTDRHVYCIGPDDNQQNLLNILRSRVQR